MVAAVAVAVVAVVAAAAAVVVVSVEVGRPEEAPWNHPEVPGSWGLETCSCFAVAVGYPWGTCVPGTCRDEVPAESCPY